MKVDGITWHAITVDTDKFETTKKFYAALLGTSPQAEADGFARFVMPDGTVLELLTHAATPSYGLNDGIALGFSVDDIDAASRAVSEAGCELIGDVVDAGGLEYRHFRGLDGRIYGLNRKPS